MGEQAGICTTFAVISHDFLYGRIIDGSLDIGNDENLLASSLELLC